MLPLYYYNKVEIASVFHIHVGRMWKTRRSLHQHPRRGRACPARALSHKHPLTFHIVGRGLDPSACPFPASTRSPFHQAPGVLKALGVKAVIAKSFARIFFRNAINIGLPAIVCKDLPDDVKTGDTMELHMSEGTAVANGKTYSCTKLPEYMQNILNQGGLIASLNREEE